MARAAAPSSSPSAPTGNGSAGANSRISGRGGSGFTSSPPRTKRRISAAPSGGDIARLCDPRITPAEHYVVEVGSGLRRHRDPDPPALGEPAIGGQPRRPFARAVLIVIGEDHDFVHY